MHSLAAVDLNLVVALHALREERSVTAAARRVGLSQPAMSHALARLRAHFDDPLLIRSGRAMAPTARALALLAEVRPAVRQLERLLAPRPPGPAALTGTVRLVCDDYIGCACLPGLIRQLRAEAPGLAVEVAPRGAPGRKALLRQGRADLALGHFSGAGMDLHRAPLFDEQWVCALRRDHPILTSPFTAAAWAGLGHVIVSPTGGRRGAVDRQLEGAGLAREVALTVPHFSAALAVVGATDLVLTTGARLVAARADALGLVALDPPLPMPPYTGSMMGHPRTEHDPTQRWFRGLVARRLGATPA